MEKGIAQIRNGFEHPDDRCNKILLSVHLIKGKFPKEGVFLLNGGNELDFSNGYQSLVTEEGGVIYNATILSKDAEALSNIRLSGLYGKNLEFRCKNSTTS